MMQVETTYSQVSIGEIVAADFRAAEIFKKAGIDFCCGGKKSLEDACKEKSMDPSNLVDQLIKLENIQVSDTQNFNDWDLGFLADYIVNTHHKYVLKSLPELVFYTQKIANVHGSHHPELIEVADLFANINAELLQHLQKEENVLFPAIKEVLKGNSSEAKHTIASEIDRMSGEHEMAGGAMDKINEITFGYKVPEDGCNTYHVAFKFLNQFEDDLHVHVHLENNILYSKALKL
jgi:regulator of cell morphogenesis and NO signaling